MTQNEHSVQVTQTHQQKGDGSVASAASLIALLPNGYKLESLTFEQTEIVLGVWTAVVSGPKQIIKIS